MRRLIQKNPASSRLAWARARPCYTKIKDKNEEKRIEAWWYPPKTKLRRMKLANLEFKVILVNVASLRLVVGYLKLIIFNPSLV